MIMNKNDVVTPCIAVCKTDPISGFCYGCGRSNEDKKNGVTLKQMTAGKMKI